MWFTFDKIKEKLEIGKWYYVIEDDGFRAYAQFIAEDSWQNSSGCLTSVRLVFFLEK
jgi:hypothetical protein